MDQTKQTGSQEEARNGQVQHSPGSHSEQYSSAGEPLSDSHRGAVANDRNNFSIFAERPIKRCRSQESAGTEFLICFFPTCALDMKYKIDWASNLLVSIPKRLVRIAFRNIGLDRNRGLGIHC